MLLCVYDPALIASIHLPSTFFFCLYFPLKINRRMIPSRFNAEIDK